MVSLRPYVGEHEGEWPGGEFSGDWAGVGEMCERRACALAAGVLMPG